MPNLALEKRTPYRRGLKPFAHYTLRFHLESWDERWNYFRFEFLHAGKVAAAGFAKGAMVGRKGWIENSEGDRRLGIGRGAVAHSPALQHWIAAEQAVASEFAR